MMSDELDKRYHSLITICLWADLDGAFPRNLLEHMCEMCKRAKRETLFVNKDEAGERTQSSSEVTELVASH